MNQPRRTANTVSCQDDCDAFSVESLQNRVIVATGSADDTFGDIDFFSRKHGTIDTAGKALYQFMLLWTLNVE